MQTRAVARNALGPKVKAALAIASENEITTRSHDPGRRIAFTTCIDYDTYVATFADCLRSARTAASLTQLALAERSGIARPNIAAYEHGRREPLFDTAMTLLEAAEAHVAIEPTIAWTWSDDRRPYAIPSRLWRLSPAACLRRFDPGPHLWWSGPRRELDLALRSGRLRLRARPSRGTPSDIEAIVDVLSAVAHLTLPLASHRMDPLIDRAGDPVDPYGIATPLSDNRPAASAHRHIVHHALWGVC